MLKWASIGWTPYALLALMAAPCTGCAPREVRPNEYRSWVSGYAFGLLGSGALDVRDLCQSRNARAVEVRQTPATVSVTLLSLGLYTPRQLRVRCAP